MCGIAGWIDHSQDMSERIDLLNRMSKTLDRRGPDENGLYINRGAALMHRRLVVIDRENGKQPMSVRHKDTTYVIVYNGELYVNFSHSKILTLFTDHINGCFYRKR